MDLWSGLLGMAQNLVGLLGCLVLVVVLTWFVELSVVLLVRVFFDTCWFDRAEDAVRKFAARITGRY